MSKLRVNCFGVSAGGFGSGLNQSLQNLIGEGGMALHEWTFQLHALDARVGDGYRMSLFYPADERTFRGKTAEREDRIRVRFVELEPARRIVEAVDFEIADRGIWLAEQR